MGYNSGNVNATLQLSEASKKTVLFATNTVDAGGSATIGTVPALKVWRIISLNIAGVFISATARNCYLELNGVDVLKIKGQGTATTTAMVSDRMTFTYETAPVLTAGQLAVITGDGVGVYSSGSIAYVEEDA